MATVDVIADTAAVALCEEGVDRNVDKQKLLSRLGVALCEEGVDRNTPDGDRDKLVQRRPLRRGRG